MRPRAIVFGAAIALAACATEPAGSPPSATAAIAASASPDPVVTKLPIGARLYHDGIRVAPDGEHILVMSGGTLEHVLYDLAGRAVARTSVRQRDPDDMFLTSWLPDSTGVVIDRQTGFAPGGVRVFEVSVLELDGREHVIGADVSVDESLIERPAVSDDGRWIAYHRGSEIVALPRDGGSSRTIVSSARALTILGWDVDGHVVYWDGELIRAMRADGDAYSVDLGLPAGVRVIQMSGDVATPDGSMLVMVVQGDRWFPGAGESSNIAYRTLVDRRIDTHGGAPAALPGGWVGGHEFLGRGSAGGVVRSDALTATSVQVLASDPERWVSAISGGLAISVRGRRDISIVDLTEGVWHDLDAGFITDTEALPLSAARFLVFDEDGYMHVVNGRAALTAPAPLPSVPIAFVNERVGLIRAVSPRSSDAERPTFVWRYPDGTRDTFDSFQGTNVIVFWDGACAACLDTVARAERVAATNVRIKLEVFAIGIGVSESTALAKLRPFVHVRPLVVAADGAGPFMLRSLPAVILVSARAAVTRYAALSEDELRAAIEDAR